MMNAIVIEKFGGRDVLVPREIPIPKPARHEVRIKIKAVGFNPVDCKIRKGHIFQELPRILGCECSGIVDAIGEKFHEFSPGDEVCAYAFGPFNGTYAQQICLPASFVTKKPKTLSFEEAAAFPITYTTAFQALIATHALQNNRSLFLAGGGGGVGSAAIALIQNHGGGPIFTTAGSAQARDYLIDRFHIPKDNILLYKGLEPEKIKNRLVEMNGQDLFYLTFDAVGQMMKRVCLELCAPYGHMITITPELEPFPEKVWERGKSQTFAKSLSVHFINSGAVAMAKESYWTMYKVQLAHLVHLFDKKSLSPPYVQHVGSFSLETVKKAHALLEEGHTKGKLVMTIDSKDE